MGLGRILIDEATLAAGIGRVAGEINRHYAGRDPLLVGILKGSMWFLADLSRKIDGPVQVEVMRASSYGHGTVSSGEVRITADVGCDLAGRDVLVVEDIIDTGLTLRKLCKEFSDRGAASVKVCALLRKKTGRNDDVPADFVAFEIDDVYVVGYGLDAAERYRTLPDIREFTPGS